MIDTHCHLNDAKYDNDIEQVIDNFLKAKVNQVICIGWDYWSSVKAKALARDNQNVYAAVGVHPDNLEGYNESEIERLLTKLNQKVVALGEIGLDYFHNKKNKEQQIEVFESQILLAKKHRFPIIIHCRDAFGDMLNILKKHTPFTDGAVMHCYSGSLDYAKEIIKLGIKLSFTGTVSYKNATNLHEVIRNIPIDSFFLETDSPYLTPEPNRGRRNEPTYVYDVAIAVATLRNEELSYIINQTDYNAKKFFKI